MLISLARRDEDCGWQGERLCGIEGEVLDGSGPGYAYNDLGERIRTALDLDDDGTMDLSGPDRVTGSLSGYVADGSDHWWRHSTSTVYAAESGDTPTVVSVQRERLSGLGQTSDLGLLTSESISLDIRGNATTSQTWTDRSAKRITRLDTIPGSANTAVQVAVNGLTVTNISATAVTVALTYDALGRQTEARTVSDGGARSVASVTAYDTLGRVASVADAANNTTRFAYDVAGRQIAATNALGQVVRTAYDSEDRVIATWGATYPVAYEFDAFGRMVAMATTRDPAQESVNLLTLLPSGGSLSESSVAALDVTRWLYDQTTGLLTNKVYADGKGPSYTYTADGKLSRRTWARGVTADYGYDVAGSLAQVVYSDATPGVTNLYDRIGRPVTVADAQGMRTNVYDASTLDLVEERLPDGTVLVRAHDSFGRPSGIALGTAYDVDYGYDPVGRFAAVTSTVGNLTNVFVYARVPRTDLIASVSNNLGHVALKSYETARDPIVTAENAFGTNIISRFDYTNDEIGRRTARVDSGVTTNAFGYNVRSELADASMGTNCYGYTYDPIGNRTVSTNNAEAFAYAANRLNQYTSIVDGGTVVPTYDDDGNLLAYGEWGFGWNGENRLILSSNAAHSVTYAYDHQGRMIEKTADGAARRLAWDGFNIVAESMSSSAQTNWYVWGLDLSGSLQGAGGVGGLLAVASRTTTNSIYSVYIPAYDANGNITEYVDANGQVVAHREYDPFGGTAALTGDKKDDFAFWWSTKPWDPIAGFSEYQFRPYSPELGRWLARDPIEERGGESLYAYVQNAAVNQADALGLHTVKRCKIGFFYGHGNTSWYNALRVEDVECSGTVGVSCESNRLRPILERKALVPGFVGTDLDVQFGGIRARVELWNQQVDLGVRTGKKRVFWTDLMKPNMKAAEKYAKEVLCKRPSCCCDEIQIYTKYVYGGTVWDRLSDLFTHVAYAGKPIRCEAK